MINTYGSTIFGCDGPSCIEATPRLDDWITIKTEREGEAGFGTFYRGGRYHFHTVQCLRDWAVRYNAEELK